MIDRLDPRASLTAGERSWLRAWTPATLALLWRDLVARLGAAEPDVVTPDRQERLAALAVTQSVEGGRRLLFGRYLVRNALIGRGDLVGRRP